MKPVPFTWDGESMFPLWRFRKLCDQQFVVGESYMLVQQEERSSVSHRHYFAAVHEGWLNLPEDMSDRFPTSEHLRKWALVRGGFADERSIVCSTKAEAQRIAAFIRPIDQYAVIIVSVVIVRVYTAQSQSKKAMGAKMFQESKQSVLDIIASLAGVKTETLVAEAGQAA